MLIKSELKKFPVDIFCCFLAINCSCLVFDGRLVIDASFHTNDPSIRAAGPLTKYKRIYHADKWTHANFNSKEIGIQVRMTSVHLLLPVEFDCNFVVINSDLVKC